VSAGDRRRRLLDSSNGSRCGVRKPWWRASALPRVDHLLAHASPEYDRFSRCSATTSQPRTISATRRRRVDPAREQRHRLCRAARRQPPDRIASRRGRSPAPASTSTRYSTSGLWTFDLAASRDHHGGTDLAVRFFPMVRTAGLLLAARDDLERSLAAVRAAPPSRPGERHRRARRSRAGVPTPHPASCDAARTPRAIGGKPSSRKTIRPVSRRGSTTPTDGRSARRPRTSALSRSSRVVAASLPISP
jgi:hypothetical protein